MARPITRTRGRDTESDLDAAATEAANKEDDRPDSRKKKKRRKQKKSKKNDKEEHEVMCAFSFMNSKRYKPMLNKRREVSGRACYLCFAAYLLPIRCACALPRSTRRLPLFMELLDRRGATLCSASACL